MLFAPDKIIGRLGEITAESLREAGVRGLILDIDYTLAPKSAPLPEKEASEFIENLLQAEVKLYLISNNHRNRVARFAQALGLPYICNGFKPFPRSFLRAVREMGLERDEVVAVGDQIFTDVVGAHLAGLKAYLVLPGGMGGRGQSFFYRLRNLMEQPFIRGYYKRHGGGCR